MPLHSNTIRMFAGAARKSSVLLFSLLFCVHAFGLRLHDYCEHGSDLENCAQHFCAVAFCTHQHPGSMDEDYCEHTHKHSLFLLCDIAPVLPTYSNNFTFFSASTASPQINTLFYLLPATQAALKICCDVLPLFPHNGPGRVCPVTGQQLPLLT